MCGSPPVLAGPAGSILSALRGSDFLEVRVHHAVIARGAAAGSTCARGGGALRACGLLGGGAMIIAYLSGRDNEPHHPMQDAMCNDYADWFFKECAAFGGYDCERLSAGLMRQAGTAPGGDGPDMQVCGEFLARCWEKILELLESYDVDLAG